MRHLVGEVNTIKVQLRWAKPHVSSALEMAGSSLILRDRGG